MFVLLEKIMKYGNKTRSRDNENARRPRSVLFPVLFLDAQCC